MRRKKCNKNTNELRASLLGRKYCKGEGNGARKGEGARPTQVIYDSIRAACHPISARPHHVSPGISHQSLTPTSPCTPPSTGSALYTHTQRVSSSFGKVQPHSSFTGNRNLFFIQKSKHLNVLFTSEEMQWGKGRKGGEVKRENVIKTQKLSWGKSRKKSIDNAVPD